MSIGLDSYWQSVLEQLVIDAREASAEALLIHFLLVDRPGEGVNPHSSGMGVMLTELVLDQHRQRHKAFSMPVLFYGQCLEYFRRTASMVGDVFAMSDPIPRPTESLALIFQVPGRRIFSTRHRHFGGASDR